MTFQIWKIVSYMPGTVLSILFTLTYIILKQIYEGGILGLQEISNHLKEQLVLMATYFNQI